MHDLSECLKYSEITYVTKEHNFRDSLISKLAYTKREGHNHIVIQETLIAPIIEKDETSSLELTQTTRWMTHIMPYLQLNQLPMDEL